jgi:hypothetical protein
MNTQISSKLAALAVALVMNTVIIGALAHLFDGQSRVHTAMSLNGATTQTARALG